jgi:anti-sigma regulatory factor (Ser/Thr protein kinase)
LNTSSTAAIFKKNVEEGHVYDERTWNDPEELKTRKMWYSIAKTLQERAVWAFVEERRPAFSAVCINPTLIGGPQLAPEVNTSTSSVLEYFTGKAKVPNAGIPWVDVRDVLNAAGKRVARRLGARKMTRDFPAQLSLVMVDQGLLEQALVNILENAIAYSPDGSTVELAAYEDRGSVVISIEDEGKGIPTAELERVFDKFRRMEEPSDRTKGAGLGLAIAKGFVEAMNGRIAAASPIMDGKGTRILISLPKAVVTHPSLL